MIGVRVALCLMLSSCLYVSGGDPPTPPEFSSQFSCVATLHCTNQADTTANFQRCESNEDDALDSVQAACEQYAHDTRCEGQTCDVSCGYRGLCLSQ